MRQDSSKQVSPPVMPASVGTPTETVVPPLSRLAVVAFILGLCGLCPLAGLPAIVLGFIAHARIARASSPRRGRGLALWGIALGSSTSLVWLGLWGQVGTRMLDVLTRRMEESVAMVFEAAVAGDARSVAAVLDGPAIDQEDIRILIQQFEQAEIDADRFSVGSLTQLEGGLTPLVEADLRCWTSDGTLWSGEATFRLRPSSFQSWSVEAFAASPRLVSLTLLGPEGRAIRYPAREIESESTSESDGSERVSPWAPPPGPPIDFTTSSWEFFR